MDVEKIKYGEVYTADSFTKIKEVPDQSVDVILTDPPYNLGMYSTGNIKMSWRSDFNNDIAHWDRETFNPADWLGEFQRILKPTGNIFGFTSYNLLASGTGRSIRCSTRFNSWSGTRPTPRRNCAGRDS